MAQHDDGMTPREALLQVAHLFDTKPGCYRFTCTTVPEPGVDEPYWHEQACVLGWVAYFADLQADKLGQHVLEVAAEFLGCLIGGRNTGANVCEFYARMDALEGDSNWTGKAGLCARLLHQYAYRYFPPVADESLTRVKTEVVS